MKFLVVGCAILVAAQALTEEGKQKIKAFKSACVEETGIDAEIVEKPAKGDYSSNDPKLNPYTFCVMKKMDVIDGTGKFKKDVIANLVDEDDKDKANEAIDKCFEKHGPVTDKNAYEHCKCYHSFLPEGHLA